MVFHGVIVKGTAECRVVSLNLALDNLISGSSENNFNLKI